MFFRPQRLVVREGSVIAIDAEAEQPDQGHQSPLFALLGLPPAIGVDMLNDATARSYFDRSDRFDMALELTAGQRGLAALGEVVGRWLSHLIAIDVAIEPLPELRDVRFSWYVGLDAEASRIGDAIWNSGEIDDAMRARLIGLYQLMFRSPPNPIGKVRGEPVYLLAAMTVDGILRLKPQNLVTGLPIPSEEAVS
jgi:hypothetical protein